MTSLATHDFLLLPREWVANYFYRKCNNFLPLLLIRICFIYQSITEYYIGNRVVSARDGWLCKLSVVL